MDMFDLTGKVAVITGASSGLGEDAAWAYARQGADIAIFARREERLKAIAEDITKETGHRVLPVKCDVSKEEDVKAGVEKVFAEFGKIDILLNNAGVAFAGCVDTMDEDEWDRGMNTNVKSIYLMSKYIVPHMKERKYGKIVNLASINAVVGDKGDMFSRHVYNASKGAVRGLTIGMAATYMEHGITVNAVGPALFESEMTKDTLMTDAYKPVYCEICPAGRTGQKGELNGTLLYLSSDASSYVTGQLILVDGGFTSV